MERRDNKEILKVIEDTIKITVNGKVDKLNHNLETHSKKLDDYINSSLDWRCSIEKSLEELKPVNTGLIWLKNTKAGAGFVAGFIAPWSIIIGVLWAIVHFIRGS